MTKEKKNSNKLIGDVLVPADEQPYEIPENWCWVRFESLKTDKKSFYDGDWILGENMNQDGEVRLLQLSDIGIGKFLDKSDKHISEDTFKELRCTELIAGDIMISRMAEPIARSCIVPEFEYKVITAVDVAVLRCNPKLIINSYVNYLCNAKWFTDKAMSMARGTTRTRITRKNLGSIAFPLPPVAEQQRIVEQIENLFSKLDAAKEKIQVVIDESENRKAAIFHKAFSGELTEKWRKQNRLVNNQVLENIKIFADKLSKKDKGFIVKGQEDVKELKMKNGGIWYKTCIGAIGIVTNGSTPSRKCPEYWNGTIPWVSSGEVKNNIISNTEEKITQQGFENSSVKKLPVGTVLMAMIGEGKTRGQSSVLNIEATTNQNIAAIIIQHGYIIPSFLWYWLQKQYRKNREKGAGSGPQALNCQRVRELEIVVPEVEEQKEIVNILDDLIMKEALLLEAAVKTMDDIDVIKKSVLAKAFRGELGTNDLSESSSIELLKEIL